MKKRIEWAPRGKTVLFVLTFGLVATTVTEASAQNLPSITGQTALQSRVGGAVQTLCGQLGAAGTNRNGASSVEDLFGRCQDLVHTANAINGSGPATFSLGLTAAQANDALVDIAHDEAGAQGGNTSQNADLQGANLTGRLATVRAGASGASMAGLSLHQGAHSLVADNQGWSRSSLAAGSDEFLSKVGVFVSGDYGFGEDDGNSEEAGYDFDAYGVTAGADYRATDNLILGVALGYSLTDNDFDRDAGELEQDNYSISAYGSTYMGNFYVDGIVSYTFLDYDLERKISYVDATGGGRSITRTAQGDTDGDEFSIGAGVGYDHSMGRMSLGLFGRATYVDTQIDSYTETGAGGLSLAISDQDIQSFETVIGADLSAVHSTGFGVMIPQIRIEWAHEFDDDSRLINAQYAADPGANQFFVRTDAPDRNYFNLGAGVSAVMAGGATAFADVETVLGREDYERYSISVGMRFEL